MNITAFRLVDVNNKRVTDIMDQVKKVQKNSGREDLVNVSTIMEVQSILLPYYLLLRFSVVRWVFCSLNAILRAFLGVLQLMKLIV